MIKKIQISWEEFGLALEELKLKIIASGKKYKYVYGIPRGGKAIALYLSHQLNLKYIDKGVPDVEYENVLIVDDIADTGHTLRAYMFADIATIYTTDWTEVTPTYSVCKKTDKDSWIIFPWENIETEDSKDETTIN